MVYELFKHIPNNKVIFRGFDILSVSKTKYYSSLKATAFLLFQHVLLNAPHVLKGLLQNVRPVMMVTTYKEQLALVIKILLLLQMRTMLVVYHFNTGRSLATV